MMKKAMRILVSVTLVISMLMAYSVVAGAGSSDDDLSVYVASDIHYRPLSALPPIGEMNNLPGDELYSHANTKSMLTYEADAIIDEFLTRFEESDSDYLLIPGDLSEDGFWEEHLGIAQKLRDFKERTGKKIFVIPGNHDIRTSDSQNRLNLSDFLEIYADIGYDEAIARHADSASYTAELGEDYRLLAIDACIYRQDGSTISDGLLSWIEEQVNAAKADGKKLIGMVHHSVLEHFGIASIGGNQLCLENYKERATDFADWGIKYFFTGHGHANDISSAVSASGNKIFDIETGSLITYPNAYRCVSFSDSAVTVKTEYIDKIDTTLLTDGYSEAQLELLENDFPAYSYGYFIAGLMSYAYEIPKLTEDLAGDLNIEKGTEAYDALTELMEMLSVAASMPLYDEAGTPEVDSIEEIAAKQGFEIVESEYSCVLEVAAVIYGGHYVGDENLDYDSPEIRLLSQGLNCVLVYAFTSMPITSVNALLSAVGLPEAGFTIIDDFYSTEEEGLYIKLAANMAMKTLIEPAANGIINDISFPADNNVTLEAYDDSLPIEGPTIAISKFSDFLNIITKFLNALMSAIQAMLVFG